MQVPCQLCSANSLFSAVEAFPFWLRWENLRKDPVVSRIEPQLIKNLNKTQQIKDFMEGFFFPAGVSGRSFSYDEFTPRKQDFRGKQPLFMKEEV